MNKILEQINYQIYWAGQTNRKPLRIVLGADQWEDFEEFTRDELRAGINKGPLVSALINGLSVVKSDKYQSQILVELEKL